MLQFNRILDTDVAQGRHKVMMKTLGITSQGIAAMSAPEVAQLATRLEQDDYTNAFDELNDWRLLRAIAFQRPELVESHVHLLELESCDEA